MISYLQIDKLTKSFGDLVLFEDITFGVAQGQKIGLIAKNGTGKTTLLNIIGGKEDYDSGEVVFRKDLRVGYLEQSPSYPEELTVLQACFHSKNETVRLIAEYEEAMAKEDHSNLEDILTRMDSFKAWDYEQKAKQILGQLKIHNFNQKIGELSGGQLKRVALANVLITDPELIILDEPTNHLDIYTRESLGAALASYEGTLVLVTHDRYLMNSLACPILFIENGKTSLYEDYDAMMHRGAVPPEKNIAPEKTASAGKAAYGKEQRRRRAELRTRIKALEDEMETLALLIMALEGEVNDPDILRDHTRLRDVCDELDDTRFHQDEVLAEWERLVEEQEAYEQENDE